MPIDVNLDGFRKRCYNISEDQLLRAGTLPFFIMRFLEGTDILVAEMPKSVFADMQQASEIAIENESFPERKLESIWNIYQQLKGIKRDLDHNIVGEDVTFVPDDRFKDVISFTSDI